MSICLLLGVAFATSAADNSVFGASVSVKLTNDVATIMVTAPLEKNKLAKTAPEESGISCTVTVHANIVYHGVSNPIKVTATASTCQAAGAAVGAVVDHLQSQYPQQ